MLFLDTASTEISADHELPWKLFWETVPFVAFIACLSFLVAKFGPGPIKAQRKRRMEQEMSARLLEEYPIPCPAEENYNPYSATEEAVVSLIYIAAILISLALCGWMHVAQNPDVTILDFLYYIINVSNGLPLFFSVLVVATAFFWGIYMAILIFQTMYWSKKADEQKAKNHRARIKKRAVAKINGKEIDGYEDYC